MWRVLGALLLAGVACTGQVTAEVTAAPASSTAAPSSPNAKLEVAWATYQLNAEPRYRLLVEGSTDGRPIDEMRLLDAGGKEIAAVATTDSAAETLKMCGPTKSSPPSIYGPSRANFALTQAVFGSFLENPNAYRIEARLRGVWQQATMKQICAVTQ